MRLDAVLRTVTQKKAAQKRAITDMIKRIKNLKKDELTKSSAVMFMSSITAGGLNYFYQIYMGRSLGPEDYGIFGAVFAIFYLTSVISQTISTSSTRFVSKFVGEGKQIGFFVKKSLKHTIIFGIILSSILIILSSKIGNILKLPDYLLIILSIILFLTLVESTINGSLRGLKSFTRLGLVGVSNSFFKLFFGVLLVIIGFKVAGALIGVVLGALISLVLSIIFIKPYVRPNNPHDPEFKVYSFYSYSLPVALTVISLSIPTNLDVIIVKYHFSAIETGIYTSVSILGKIILFIPGAIFVVMFPMIAESYAKKDNNEKKILKKSFVYTGILSGIIALSYILFPELVIKIFGARYESAVNYISLYGASIFFFSLIMTMINYHLAIKNIKYITMFVFFTIVEIILLTVLHQSMIDIVKVLFFSNLTFLIMSMIYTFRGVVRTV